MIDNELLLHQSFSNAHCMLTVGVMAGHYGYFNSGLSGSINKIPFWFDKDYGNVKFMLNTLAYSYNHDTTVLQLKSETGTSSSSPSVIKTTINGRLVSLYPDEPFSDQHPGDPFNLSQSVGKTLSVIFDPPPRRLHHAINTLTRLQEESADAKQKLAFIDVYKAKAAETNCYKQQQQAYRRIYYRWSRTFITTIRNRHLSKYVDCKSSSIFDYCKARSKYAYNRLQLLLLLHNRLKQRRTNRSSITYSDLDLHGGSYA